MVAIGRGQGTDEARVESRQTMAVSRRQIDQMQIGHLASAGEHAYVDHGGVERRVVVEPGPPRKRTDVMQRLRASGVDTCRPTTTGVSRSRTRPDSVTAVVAKAVATARNWRRAASWWMCRSHMSASSTLTSKRRRAWVSVVIAVRRDQFVGHDMSSNSVKNRELGRR